MAATQRYAVNGIELDVIEAGDPAGPGRRAVPRLPRERPLVAPPDRAARRRRLPRARARPARLRPLERAGDVAAYGIEHLCGDLLGLLDATGHDDAVFVGHDWGALLVWDLARLHPDRVRAVVNVSVPYTEWPAPPTEVFKAASGDRFFYILYFQEVGPAEARAGRSTSSARCAPCCGRRPATASRSEPPTPPPAAGTGWLDVMGARTPPAELPAWLTEDDLAAYVDSFEASGFFGPVSWYRNLDHNHALVKDRPAPAMPVWFIGGTARRRHRLPARATSRRWQQRLPDHRGTMLIEGAGHWTQQEAPEAFNRALLAALAELDATADAASR